MFSRILRIAVSGWLLLFSLPVWGAEGVIEIGSRRELFVDSHLIEGMKGVRLELGRPESAGVAIRYDQPWEGRFSFYTTVIKDGDLFRMYYRGASSQAGVRYAVCYAESKDGMAWTKPELGLIETHGTKQNNVVLLENQGLTPFLDTKPGVSKDERFKGNVFIEQRFGAKQDGLKGYVSPDGIHWKGVSETPIVPAVLKNNFDSQNVMFWSEAEKKYVLFARHTSDGFRAQSRATAEDFRAWSPQVLMSYSDTGTTIPSEQLYTSQVQPYFRGAQIYISLPGRLMEGRKALTVEDAKRLDLDPLGGGSNDCADGVLMTTRAGATRFDRTFLEAFVRPGLDERNWGSRTNYPACGIIQTGLGEMSIFVQRNYGATTAYLERMKLRLDGFASVRAPFAGGELVTRAFTFTGKHLDLNAATSAAGSIRVEIQDAQRKAIAGYGLNDCREVLGDRIAQRVAWKGGDDVGGLAGKVVRLRFVMKDADLYSLRFGE